MKINITPQTQARIHSLAKETYSNLVEGYCFDGQSLKPTPAVSINNSIIQKMTSPDQLLRLKLEYGEEGPDDRWKAHSEMLLGGGIKHKDKLYRVLGAGSSLKDGCLWLATDELRRSIHQYFSSAQEALSYLGVFFSGCHHGIWELNNIKGIVVEDGDEGTADGMGFVSNDFIKRSGLSHRQLQIRMVGEDWLCKGTVLPKELPDNMDFILPKSMIKGAGMPPNNRSWSGWFGIRDIAQTRPYNASFTFSQWFKQSTFKALYPNVDNKLRILNNALSDREHALRFLGLMKYDDVLLDARTKAEAFLEAGLAPDHPWLHRQLIQLMRKAYIQLAMGGGFEFEGRMGAWADLPDSIVCACDLPAGSVVLSRYPIRDPHSIQSVWNEPDAVKGARQALSISAMNLLLYLTVTGTGIIS